MTWFKTLTGLEENQYEATQEQLEIDGSIIKSKVNGKTYDAGTLEITSLDELRDEVEDDPDYFRWNIGLSEVIGDVQQLHVENPGSVFQVASQFNLLEMAGPNDTPEIGIGGYEDDYTQGPACAIACGAGTIYRNYLVPVGDQIGQTADCQIDCLSEIGVKLNNAENGFWKMQNGYAMLDPAKIHDLNKKLGALSERRLDLLASELKIGIQWNTEITLNDNKDKVTQVYAAALPLGYLNMDKSLCQPFAQLILDATYEAAFMIVYKNNLKTRNKKLFLTLVGGGVFENPQEWIISAIRKAAMKFRRVPLDIKIVSYGSSNPLVRDLVEEFKV